MGKAAVRTALLLLSLALLLSFAAAAQGGKGRRGGGPAIAMGSFSFWDFSNRAGNSEELGDALDDAKEIDARGGSEGAGGAMTTACKASSDWSSEACKKFGHVHPMCKSTKEAAMEVCKRKGVSSNLGEGAARGLSQEVTHAIEDMVEDQVAKTCRANSAINANKNAAVASARADAKRLRKENQRLRSRLKKAQGAVSRSKKLSGDHVLRRLSPARWVRMAKKNNRIEHLLKTVLQKPAKALKVKRPARKVVREAKAIVKKAQAAGERSQRHKKRFTSRTRCKNPMKNVRKEFDKHSTCIQWTWMRTKRNECGTSKVLRKGFGADNVYCEKKRPNQCCLRERRLYGISRPPLHKSTARKAAQKINEDWTRTKGLKWCMRVAAESSGCQTPCGYIGGKKVCGWEHAKLCTYEADGAVRSTFSVPWDGAPSTEPLGENHSESFGVASPCSLQSVTDDRNKKWIDGAKTLWDSYPTKKTPLKRVYKLYRRHCEPGKGFNANGESLPKKDNKRVAAFLNKQPKNKAFGEKATEKLHNAVRSSRCDSETCQKSPWMKDVISSSVFDRNYWKRAGRDRYHNGHPERGDSYIPLRSFTQDYAMQNGQNGWRGIDHDRTRKRAVETYELDKGDFYQKPDGERFEYGHGIQFRGGMTVVAMGKDPHEMKYPNADTTLVCGSWASVCSTTTGNYFKTKKGNTVRFNNRNLEYPVDCMTVRQVVGCWRGGGGSASWRTSCDAGTNGGMALVKVFA